MRTELRVLVRLIAATLLALAFLPAPALGSDDPVAEPSAPLVEPVETTAPAAEPAEPVAPAVEPVETNEPASSPRPQAAAAEDEDPATGTDGESEDSDQDEDPEEAEEVPTDGVQDAVLRWGMTNEANNRSPSGAFNFLSAGKVAKPANGVIPQPGCAPTAGPVSIEKWDGTAYQPATWAGLRTDSEGNEIKNYLSGRYSGHQFVFTGGTGVIDRAAGTAHIEWKGDVSVVFYGGMVFFYLSDPVLDLANGKGMLTGTVSGFGSSQADPGTSFPVDPVKVTLADLPGLTLGDLGFTVTPAYDNVKVNVDGQQVTGSFPQSFVTAMESFGTAGFWYRTNSGLDPAKKPLPVTVSYSALDPLEVAPPPTEKPRPEIVNKTKKPPKTKRQPASAPQSAPPPVSAPAPAFAAPPPALAAPVAAAGALVASPTTQSEVVQLVAAHSSSGQRSSDTGWWLGGGLFLLAALVVASALLTPSRVSGRSA